MARTRRAAALAAAALAGGCATVADEPRHRWIAPGADARWLLYGAPDSDDVALALGCEPGGALSLAVIGGRAAPGPSGATRPSALTLRVGGRRWRLPTIVSGSDAGGADEVASLSGVAGVMAAMRAGGRLRIDRSPAIPSPAAAHLDVIAAACGAPS
jgi:hypothetical protein